MKKHNEKHSKKTQLITAGRDSKHSAGAVNPPIYRTSTVLFNTVDEYEKAELGKFCYDEIAGLATTDFSYGISGTATTAALQSALSELEGISPDGSKSGGGKTFITPSGLSAITLVFYSFLKAGDHVLVADNVYGPNRRFCNKELKKYNIEVTYFDPNIGADIAKLIKQNTVLIFLESPGSLTFEIADSREIIKAARKKSAEIIIATDNSWATSLYFQPRAHGFDVSIQALTKYICGHSDVILGAVHAYSEFASRQIARTYRNTGVSTSPDDCYQALRGLRTLSTRLEKHHENALKVAQWLEKRPEIEQVFYPALKSDKYHKLWRRDFSGAGGLLSVCFKKKYERARLNKFIESPELFGIGCSWGGYESLVLPLDPAEVRTAAKWPYHGSFVRIFCGLEDADDLLADLAQALKKLS